MSERVDGYAAGLVALAKSEGQLERVAEELFQLGRTFEANDELRTTLIDRVIPASRRIGVIEDLLADRASPVTLNLVSMIIGAGRGADLAGIADAVVARAAESRDEAVAEVRSAVSLSSDQIERLSAALATATGKRVDIKVVIDPDIVGGLVTQVGDTVFDGSVRTRLDKMKERLS
jgi:F-type H+-transporting ATPase subunit delta